VSSLWRLVWTRIRSSSNGPGSAAANAGVPLNQQTAWADSSRAGQWYNGQGYLGVGSATYSTLTIFRQTALT